MATIKQIKEKAQSELEMYKKGKLFSSASNASNYHEADNLIHAILEITDSLPETDEMDDSDKLQDIIMETANNNTPVYNDDIAQWFADNWTAYDEVREELGNDGMGEDIMRGIMIAYCVTFEQALQELLTDYAAEIDNERHE